ncbi:tachykinin-like peptides receptor 86C [Acropora muricata]|uniref:tachykinin-like peptides receptor 86C n=1 Tax=Acropora muricata TaxID=159855 RepID=UPI0034E5DE0E
MSWKDSMVFEILTAIIITVGLVGNFIVCLLIIKGKKMRTPFNYLLLNLAMSDLLCTICASLFFAGQIRNHYHFTNKTTVPYRFERIVCKIGTISIAFTTNTSVLTLAAISTDRYYSIVHPWRHKSVITTRRICACVVAIWLLSGITSIPYAVIMSDDVPHEVRSDSSITRCLQHLIDKNIFKPVAFIDLIIAYIMPMAIILRTSFAIIKHLWCNSSRQKEPQKQQWSRSITKSRKRITRVIFSIVVAFNIFWLPWAILEGALLIGAIRKFDDNVFTPMLMLVIASASVNPILYSFQSRQFRDAVKRMCC